MAKILTQICQLFLWAFGSYMVIGVLKIRPTGTELLGNVVCRSNVAGLTRWRARDLMRGGRMLPRPNE